MKDNPEFTIDKYSESYILRHPHMKKQLLKEKRVEQEKLEKQLRVNKKKYIDKEFRKEKEKERSKGMKKDGYKNYED